MRSLREVETMALELGISPGIIVGRMHFEALKPPNWGTELITRYHW